MKDIDLICHSLCRFLKNKYPNLIEEDVQKIKEDFLKITIFDKIIANWDRNPENWGLIVTSTGDVKIAHELDNNKAFDIQEYYSNYNRDMYLNRDDHTMQTLLEYCFSNFLDSDEFLKFIEDCMKNIDVKKACEDIQKKKGIFIPKEEIIDMDSIVRSRGFRQIHWYLERKKVIQGEEERT